MKTKTLKLMILTLGFYSCAIHHGNFNCSTSIQNGNFITIRPVEGSSNAIYIFGLGGLQTDKLVFEAKENLYNNANLQKNQAIANVVIDNKYVYILPFYIKHNVYLNADVIEFTNNGERIKSTNQESTPIDKLDAISYDKLDTTSFLNKDSQRIKIGTRVECTDFFGIKYLGVVIKIHQKAVEVEYYSKLEGYKFVEVKTKNVKKTQ